MSEDDDPKGPPDRSEVEETDDTLAARRRLLKLGLWSAPLVIGTLSLKANAAPPSGVPCEPNACLPHPCGPLGCKPRT